MRITVTGVVGRLRLSQHDFIEQSVVQCSLSRGVGHTELPVSADRRPLRLRHRIRRLQRRITPEALCSCIAAKLSQRPDAGSLDYQTLLDYNNPNPPQFLIGITVIDCALQ
jgi:hypothetical protein